MKPARWGFVVAFCAAVLLAAACGAVQAAPTTSATVRPGLWTLDGTLSTFSDQAACVAAASAMPVGTYVCRQQVGIAVAIVATGAVGFIPWLGPADAVPTKVIGYHIWKAQVAAGASCPASDTAIGAPSPWQLAATVVDPDPLGTKIVGLTNGVRWCFKITAYSDSGDSADSYIVYRDVP